MINILIKFTKTKSNIRRKIDFLLMCITAIGPFSQTAGSLLQEKYLGATMKRIYSFLSKSENFHTLNCLASPSSKALLAL